MKAECKKREEIEQLPPAVFLLARRLRKKGKFERRIVKRAPRNLDWDMVELDCGHKTDVLENSADTARECSTCMEAWLRRNAKTKEK